jgi:hypothetical protein
MRPLRSKGGRGPSAALVTAGDAANLLIAMLVYTSGGMGKGLRKRSPAGRGDLHQTGSISFATIRALGSLIERGPK